MATLFVYANGDDMPKEHQDLFWNFPPDDWDYFILGHEEDKVRAIADNLYICDFDIKQFGSLWAAVTYHS